MFLMVSCVLCVPWGGGGAEGTVTLGKFPWGCEDTVTCRWLLSNRGVDAACTRPDEVCVCVCVCVFVPLGGCTSHRIHGNG